MIRRWLRALVLWLVPELRELGAYKARMGLELAGHDAGMRQAKRELAEWARYTQKLGELVCLHEREVQWLKVREASGATFKGLDIRLARIEMLLQPAISDGAVESPGLDEALARVEAGRKAGDA